MNGNRRRFIVIASVLLIALLAGAAAVVIHGKQAPPSASLPTPKNVVTKTLARPSTAQPTAQQYTAQAGPDEPTHISLPTIGASGYIQNVGIDQYKQMAAPTNVHVAGWYVDSLLPGQAGLSIIDGHIDGYAHNQGIFGKLNKLKTGDIFMVAFGNGSSKSFKVKSVQLVTATNVPEVLFAHDPTIPSQLNLITCGGNYDGVSHTYDQRTIVVSALV
ncbi:MAG TPA: class F sortase [Candidatus Saccharimonadales bacterium]|nr:class F sortase [Candidatus Saccharimonadales bacterium]